MNVKRELSVTKFSLELLFFLNYVLPGLYAIQFKSVNILPDDDFGETDGVNVDNGYGSRVQTSDAIAKGTLLQRLIFGAEGPGRRRRSTEGPGRRRRSTDTFENMLEALKGHSLTENDEGIEDRTSGKRKHNKKDKPKHNVYCFEILQNGELPVDLHDLVTLDKSKRLMSASKTFSENIAGYQERKGSKKPITGSPGARVPQASDKQDTSNTFNNNLHTIHEQSEKQTGISKRRRVSDGGYGSRVLLYSNMANHTIKANTLRDLYGLHGPGKR